MTWGVTITDGEGRVAVKSQHVCSECKHGGDAAEGLPYRNGHPVCNVQAAAQTLATLLTTIGVGADSHMAGGNMILNCYGFEPKD